MSGATTLMGVPRAQSMAELEHQLRGGADEGASAPPFGSRRRREEESMDDSRVFNLDEANARLNQTTQPGTIGNQPAPAISAYYVIEGTVTTRYGLMHLDPGTVQEINRLIVAGVRKAWDMELDAIAGISTMTPAVKAKRGPRRKKATEVGS